MGDFEIWLPPSVAPIRLTNLWCKRAVLLIFGTGGMVALLCRLIILSKLLSRNDVRLIGLKSFAVGWVAFPALGIKSTFVSCHAVGSSPAARMEWKIFFNQIMAICPACWVCTGLIPSDPGDLYGLKL